MPQIIRSPQANDDVYEIASYIARDNLEAALRSIDTIDKKLLMLGTNLRSLPVGITSSSTGQQKTGLKLYGCCTAREICDRCFDVDGNTADPARGKFTSP
jgi:hypothetical protein